MYIQSCVGAKLRSVKPESKCTGQDHAFATVLGIQKRGALCPYVLKGTNDLNNSDGNMGEGQESKTKLLGRVLRRF